MENPQEGFMRCFISIDLPKEIQKELSEAQGKIYSEEAKLLNVKPENIHITLKFLGELDENQVGKVQDVMNKSNFRKFRAKLGSIGVFPDEKFIRVVWVGIEPGEKVDEIHSILDSSLESEGFQKDREFENHATLARVKTVKDKKEFMEQLKKIKVKPLEFEINEIHLKESILTPEGPIYSDLMKIRLS